MKESVRFCARCFNYAEDELCEICRSSNRDARSICVVGEPRDIPPIERTAVYSGLYHVLGGELSPMEGVGPDNLHIAELMKRLASEDIEEVVLATIPTWRRDDGRLSGASHQGRLAFASRVRQAAFPLAAIWVADEVDAWARSRGASRAVGF